MKKLFAIISLFALVLTSCEKEETIVIGSNFDTITATIESAADTKATLHTSGTGQEVPVKWKDYDEISVFFQDGAEFKNVLYRLNSGENTTEGIFQKGDNVQLGENATIVAAVYPYNANATYTNGTINVPATEIKGQSNINIINAGPMAAKANGTSNSLEFKNVGAYVRVTVSNIPTGYTSVELSSETSNLSGAYSLVFDSNCIPTAELTGNNKTITYSGNSGIGDETIYFPVFAGTYSDLKVTAKGTSKPDITLIAPKALTAVRNTIHYTSREVNSYNNINPVELPTNQGKELSIVIESDDETITVKEESGASVTGNVNILINEGALAQNQIRNLIINLPQATVLLSGDTEYTNITSTTASNTLILGNGVIVKNVEVKKGNIQVNTGATLNGISFSNEQGAATSVNIIKNGGTVNVTESSNIIVNESIGEYDLIQAAKAGGTYTLTGDVTLSEILTIDKNFVLDGNEFTLTSTADRAINVGKSGSGDLNVTIKNLTIETSGQRAINLIQGSHNVTIENVKASASNYTVNVAASAPNSTVTITESELTGLNTINIGANNTTMTVSDSELTTNDNSPSEGYGTISISPYNAGESSILSGSSVTVENCEFITSGTNANYTHNISYAPELSSVNITGKNSSEISIEEVKAILPVNENYFYSEGTLEELITKCNSGNTTDNTIILVGDVTVTQNITCNKNLILDLNDCTMTIDTAVDQHDCGLIFEGNTTIKNGKIVTKSGYPLVFNNETEKKEVIITGIDIVGNRNEGENGNLGTIIMGGNAIVTINDDVNISATNYSCIIEGTSNDAMSNYAEININGGNFSLINESSNQATVLGAGFGSTINVYNGVFDGTEANFVASAYPSGGIINIENGTFKGELKEYTTDGKTVEISIKGGTFTVDPSQYLLGGYSAAENNSIWTVSATGN